jgi:hypothetical protein
MLMLVFASPVACAGSGGVEGPVRLLDGSRAPAVPEALDSLPDRAVMTRVRVVRVRRIEPELLEDCLRLVGPARAAPGDTIVQRVGLDGASITFRRGRWLRGCDRATFEGRARRWCGGAVGRLRPDGRLFDPRLDLACRDADGRRLGFAWIDATPGARYVVVESRGHAEIYPTAGLLPVRLTTSDVSNDTSSASFTVRQYAGDGREIASETLHSVVAG